MYDYKTKNFVYKKEFDIGNGLAVNREKAYWPIQQTDGQTYGLTDGQSWI